MSQSKKNWNAGKAQKRSADASKKNLKEKAAEAKESKKRTIKGTVK
jgi:hypothetical protein